MPYLNHIQQIRKVLVTQVQQGIFRPEFSVTQMAYINEVQDMHVISVIYA